MSNKPKTDGKLAKAEYASKERVRKASEVGLDLGALVQASPQCSPEDVPACQAAIWSHLAELMAAPASTVEDAQAFAVWAGKMNDLRKDFAGDAASLQVINTCIEKLQTRTVETLASITGMKAETFNGDDAPTLN